MTIEQDRTVFVIGAGASVEFGLPVGTSLQEKIRYQTKMDVRDSSFQAFSHNGYFLDQLPEAAGLRNYTMSEERRLARKSHYISEGVRHAASIDNYLHAHRSDPELVAIGKLAIATCILNAEKASSLAYNDGGKGFRAPRPDAKALQPHYSWLGLLLKTLSAGRDFSDFCTAVSTITFVCFNYDRCIERYFFEAAALIYPVGKFDIEALESALTIIHPYGSLGDLKPENGTQGTFGRSDDRDFVISAANGIRTFTEGMQSDVGLKIGEAFVHSTRAIFLGYGFISVNDKFLFNESPFQIRSVLATAYGLSDERADSVAHKLKHTCMMLETPHDGMQQRGTPQLRNEGCADLMQRFSHLLEEIGK